MTVLLLLGAAAVSVAAEGGTSGLELLVVLVLLVAAVLASRTWPPVPARVVVAAAGLLTWLLVDGPLRTGVDLTSLRVPALLLVAFSTVQAVRTLDAQQRLRLVEGLVLVGVLQALVVVGQGVDQLSQGRWPPRSTGTLGSANGVGVLLVATAVLAAAMSASRPRVRHLAAGVMAVGVVATGSRTAAALGALAVAAGLLRRRSVGGWAAAAAASAALVVVVAARRATDAVAEQRPHLWHEALARIRSAPLTGHGPEPLVYSTTSPAARLTTHAHDELLQLGADYGLVAVALLALLVVLLARMTRPSRLDPACAGACAAVLVGGLVDVALRITALVLVAAASAALAASTTAGSAGDGPAPPRR